jgi:hypothetical protein
MSRRCHHGHPRHARLEGHDMHRPMTNARAEIASSGVPLPVRESREAPSRRDDSARREVEPIVEERIARATPPPAGEALPEQPRADDRPRADPGFVRPEGQRRPAPAYQAPHRPAPALVSEPADQGVPVDLDRGATAPQLRRFIKSRAYVPIHELRRRFGLNGDDDDVTPVDLDRTRVFVGLPDREGRLLGELLRAGDIGYELSMDPVSPIVVGVYPMRPVTRN